MVGMGDSLSGLQNARRVPNQVPALSAAFWYLRSGSVLSVLLRQQSSRRGCFPSNSQLNISMKALILVSSCPVGGPTWKEPSSEMLGTPSFWK